MADRHAVIYFRRVDPHPKYYIKGKAPKKPKGGIWLGTLTIGADLDVCCGDKWRKEHGPFYTAGEGGTNKRVVLMRLKKLARDNGATSIEVLKEYVP